MRKTIASYSDMMTNRKVNSSCVNLHHPTSNCVWPDEIENLGLLSLIMVAWARADQNKGTRVVSDGLSHCCSTTNPLHQTWAHTATYRNMGNRQRCNSLAHILATVKNIPNTSTANVSVLYLIVLIMDNQEVNERCFYISITLKLSFALLYTFIISCVSVTWPN